MKKKNLSKRDKFPGFPGKKYASHITQNVYVIWLLKVYT